MLAVLGRLIARIHLVAATIPFRHRIRLDETTYGHGDLEFLLTCGKMPRTLVPAFREVGTTLCASIAERFVGYEARPIHGDLHHGNILWQDSLPCIVDFDDALNGPRIQDFWLLLAGRDDDAKRSLYTLLNAYSMMCSFDTAQVVWIEGLRALRYIHYAAWIARRWEDDTFQRHFPHFGTESYWNNLLDDLKKQLTLVDDERLWRL